MKLVNFNFGSKDGPNKLVGLEKQFIKALNTNPDIAFFQEVLIFSNSEIPKEVKQDYHIIYSRYNMIMLRKDKFEEISVSKDQSFEFYYRNIYLQTKFKEKQQEMLIINTHTPTLDKKHRDLMIKHLHSIFEGETKIKFEKEREFSTIIIGGDFNTRLNSKKHLFDMRFLITDSNHPTTVNKRTIDGIYFKQNHLIAQSFKSENIKIENEVFDHLYQVTEIEFPSNGLKELQKLALKLKKENLNFQNTNLLKDDEILAVKVRGEFRRVFMGPRSGFYYLTKSNNKIYISSSKEAFILKNSEFENHINGNEIKEEIKEIKIEERKMKKLEIMEKMNKIEIKENEEKLIDVILVNGKYCKVFTGPKGGMFYWSPSLNRVYIKNLSRIEKRLEKDIL